MPKLEGWANLRKNNVLFARKIRFFGISPIFDVYNPSKTFKFEGKNYIFGRVERRRDHAKSKVFLFEEVSENVFKVDKRFKSLDLEDPFVTKIGAEFVFGGVKTKRNPISGKIVFKTVFYRFRTPFLLNEFAKGPEMMKDIRLVGIEEGIVGVFTRPMGEKFGRGRIGFTIINSLDELNEEKIKNAKLIDFPFEKGEWGGVNDCVFIGKNNLGVLGHRAFFSGGEKRNYFPISFVFNIKTRKISKMKLLFKREDLGFELPKSKFLYNVIFPGGFQINKDKITLYCGVGDTVSYRVLLDNPFK